MTILDYLEKSAERFPDKAAFSDQEKTLTFGALSDNAERVATALAREIGERRKPIVVVIDRNVESICAFLAVAMTGNFYVPLDPALPPQRILGMIGQLKPSAIVQTVPLPEDVAEQLEVPCFDYADLVLKEPDPALLLEIRAGILDTDPLYAICTSGSTGVPKSVLIAHHSVTDFIPVFSETFSFDGEERFGNQAPFDFDVSVKDIYTTLYCGAYMHILPRVCFSMPKMLLKRLSEQQITTIIWAVSALSVVAEVDAFKNGVPGSLKKILFSGEVMPVKVLNIWREHFPDAMFVNLYGPTEITCNCMYYVIDRSFGPSDRIPLGKAFQNERILILGEDGRPVRPGGTGEICVLGTCLALGYYGDPEKTAKAFVQNPLNEQYPELMYRTGDLAEYSETGELFFSARKDRQIKHMGHRIELEEIETFLNRADGVTRACCLFDADKNKIVAFYVGTAEKKAIVLQLRESLPKYMIPNVFLRLDSMPLTKNGKVNREELKQQYLQAE